MSTTVSVTDSNVVSHRPAPAAKQKREKTNTNAQNVLRIVSNELCIEKIRNDIKEFKSKNWSNFEIAHYYVSLNDPDRKSKNKVEKNLRYVPVVGKTFDAVYEKTKKTRQIKTQLKGYIEGICGIALTYNPSISKPIQLFLPIMKTLLYGVDPDNAQKISLREKDSEKIKNLFRRHSPKFEGTQAVEYAASAFVMIIAFCIGWIPILGHMFRNNLAREYKKERSLVDIRNMVDLIGDYELISPTAELKSIKKEMITSQKFNHLTAPQDGWYNNPYVLSLLSIASVIFIFPLPLLIVALWLNQTRSQGWLWYMDKRVVIINLILVAPIGLYGVAKGGLFSYGPKWYDNRAYLIYLISLLPFVITSPVSLYAVIRSKAMGLAGKIITFLMFSGYVSLIFLATQLPSS